MSIIASLKLVEFKPQAAQGRIFVRRRVKVQHWMLVARVKGRRI